MSPAKVACLCGIAVFLTIWVTLAAMGIEQDSGTYSLVAAVVIGISVYMVMQIPPYRGRAILPGGWTVSAIIAIAISIISIVITIVIAIIQHQNAV